MARAHDQEGGLCRQGSSLHHRLVQGKRPVPFVLFAPRDARRADCFPLSVKERLWGRRSGVRHRTATMRSPGGCNGPYAATALHFGTNGPNAGVGARGMARERTMVASARE